MCDQTEVQYLPGEVVWVKLRALWWPGLVQDYDSLPEEITCSLRKRPIATVKFFQEDSYEYVHKLDLIYHYNCSRKHEFIKKGLDLFRKKTADRPSKMDIFPMDIVTAEEMTNGDPNILQDDSFKPDDKPKYTSLFGSLKKKFGKGKRGKEDSPLKEKVARTKKLTSKLEAMGWISRNITANIIYPSPDTPRIVTHRRFVNKVRNPDAKSDYEARIMEQKCEDDPSSILDKTYECVLCGYATRRLNVIVLHFNTTHSRKTKNVFSAPSILKGGSLRNPLLKLKAGHRKSDPGRLSLMPKKRTSLKRKSEKPKRLESEGYSSDDEKIKPQPVKKEKGKPGRKRKVKPEEVENEESKEVVKKPKVLDSLLADWEEDAEQENEDGEHDNKDDSDDETNASIDNDSACAIDESSLAADASSSSKSKEVFEFDPDEDDNMEFDLTPNVKGFGRRIPRVIESAKEKKSAVSGKKATKSKLTKKEKEKEKEEEVDDFESLLAETSVPSLPSVPNANNFSLDTDDKVCVKSDEDSDASSPKPVLKEQNEPEGVKLNEQKQEKSKNSDPEVDLAVDSKRPPQVPGRKNTAKVTVEKVPDLVVTRTDPNDEILPARDTPKNDGKPVQSTSGGDHTYVSGNSGRKRRRSLLPIEKSDGTLDIMAMPVVLDDDLLIEEKPRVSKTHLIPQVAGSHTPAPRRVGRPPKRGGGAARGSRSIKSSPPQQTPKSPPTHRSSKSPSPHLSSKSPPPHLNSKSPPPPRSMKSPSPRPGSMSPPSQMGPKSPPPSQGPKSPAPHRSPKSPPPEQTPQSPDPTPKSPTNRQSTKSPSVHFSPKRQTHQIPKSPQRVSMSPEPHPSPKSPRSPQPHQSPLHQGPKSPQGFQSPKSPPMSPPALLSPKSPKNAPVASDLKSLKSPPLSPVKTTAGDLLSLGGSKTLVKSPQTSPVSQAIMLSSSTPSKGLSSKVLTQSSTTAQKKVSTSSAVIVQSKPDLQPEACGIGKIFASAASSVASTSGGTVKTIKVMSGTPGSSPALVGKTGTPGTPTRKVMIVQGKGGQKMFLPAGASEQFLSNIKSGNKIIYKVITKGSGSQQQKILVSGGKVTSPSGQVVSSKGTVLSSVAKLVTSKPSTSGVSTIAGGVELSTEPPALVKTDGKKTYKIITSPQSKGNILLNTSGGQILLPVSSMASSGSGVTTASGAKQFILPVGAKNMKFLSGAGGTGQRVILQMKSSPSKAGVTSAAKLVQPIVPKTVQSVAAKTVQPISPKAVQSITPKTVQPITPKTVQPITPKTSQPMTMSTIATMVQPIPQLTPIGSPKAPRQKQAKVAVVKPSSKSPAQPKSPRKSAALAKGLTPATVSSSSTASTVVLPPLTPQKRSTGVVPNPNLKSIVPQAKPTKNISLAAKPSPLEPVSASPMPGTMQVVTGAVPGLEQIQTTLVQSADTSSTLPLPTSTQQYVAVPTEDGGQVMYLIDNSSLINLDGSNSGNLGNIILTFDNLGQPVSSAASDFTFSAPSSGQDILAEALANTQVLQPEVPGGELGLDTSGLLSSHTSSTIYQPTLSHGVLETSLTLNQPIMTPLEDLSAVSTLQPPPTSAALVDLPSTITVPDITISTSSYASLPIPSATIQSTVFSEAQNITTFSTSASDGNVFIEAPSVEGESFLTADGMYEQSSEGASMPLLDG